MGQFVDDLAAFFIIFISTIIVMIFKDFLPNLIFPGFSVVIALTILVLSIELVVHREEEASHYLGTVIGIFVGYFLLILLGLSIQTILEIPTALNVPHISTISSILELPIMSDLYIIEGLIISMIAVKVKFVVSLIISD